MQDGRRTIARRMGYLTCSQIVCTNFIGSSQGNRASTYQRWIHCSVTSIDPRRLIRRRITMQAMGKESNCIWDNFCPYNARVDPPSATARLLFTPPTADVSIKRMTEASTRDAITLEVYLLERLGGNGPILATMPRRPQSGSLRAPAGSSTHYGTTRLRRRLRITT